MNPELTMLYVHGESIGYGRLGVNLAKHLSAAGVDVYDHLESPVENSQWEHLNKGRKAKRTNVVCWVSVPTHARGWWKGQIPVCFSMWESTCLPEDFRQGFDNFDTIVVPSQQNVELFGQYHRNVKLCPLGIDPAVWHYVPRTTPAGQFNFLIGGSGDRKGTDLAYRAFRKVFKTWPKDGPVPHLIMKSPRPEPFYGDRILRIGGRISPEDEVALYASAHCYLQPSRGEGFGLQPLQALAQGCPTILTNAHGHTAFAHLGMGLDTTLKQSSYFIYGDAGDWWEPDLDQLCQYMEWVYANYEEACATANVSAQVVAEQFTWQRTAQSFIDAVGQDALTAPCSGTGEWFEPDVRRYLVVLERDWKAEIAGVTYMFRAGERYYELADVKRILMEAGLLANECLTTKIGGSVDDLGLAPHQLAALGDYSASHSYCPHCQQKLGSGTLRPVEELA